MQSFDSSTLHKRPANSESAERVVRLPENFNYIGAFLTFKCPYNCSYCLTRFEENPARHYEDTSGDAWIRFLGRLKTGDVPVTLQGGEPGAHPDFFEIVSEVLNYHQVDILTNLEFDIDAFAKRVSPEKINRNAPYAPIRVSYHPGQVSRERIIHRMLRMQQHGFSVGLYGVMHPEQKAEMQTMAKICSERGIDFRTKPFLGYYKGELYGEYAYEGACALNGYSACKCAPSELLIAPDGGIFPCHHHLYNRVGSVAHIEDPELCLTNAYRHCEYYGHCHPCDVKRKNNRFQQFGHVSVDIRFPEAEGSLRT